MTGFLDNLLLAIGTLRSNPLRSMLTLLGIVIGVVTVVAMMSLTEGLRLRINKDLAELGAGSFQVQKWPVMSFGPNDWAKYARRKNFTLAQGQALKELCPHVGWVSVEQYMGALSISTHLRATPPNVTFAGVLPDYERSNGITVNRGRFVSDVDVALDRRVAVIGADIADVLFPRTDPIGEEIRVRNVGFTVIGVFERLGANLGGGSRDTVVVVPITAFQQAWGRQHNINIAISPIEVENSALAQDEVVIQLRRLRGVRDGEENDFEIFSNETVTGMFNNIAATVSAATFGVCALALLVGGIGIMNIMLVSVAERTREIGIRKALGARRRRILSQFVIEAITLSLMGGVIGVTLGAVISIGARELFQLTTSIPLWSVVLSLASASGCGLLFGIYPAVRASRLDPVEAMRTE
jgi:putative ABC transport system permease protein